MELQSSRRSSTIAKRLWNFLRITFFMMRKGLISKKKLLMDINLFFKRGKLIRKSLSNLISHHHHNHNHSNHRQMMATRGNFAQREYEFSCSNSPSNPVFPHVPSWSKRKHHHHTHLPCMNPPLVLDELESISHEEVGNIHDDDDNYDNALALIPMTPEYAFNLRLDGYDLAPGDNRSPLISPCPIKISDYSSEEEINDGRNVEVDDEAEDFIQKFYEQLRAQSRVQLLQY